MGAFDDRTTGEVLVIVIVGTVCALVLLGAVAVLVIAVVDSERDISSAISFLGNVTNTLVGVAAGFLAGRTNRAERL